MPQFIVRDNSYEKALVIIIGSHVIHRVVNPSTWIIEYIVHEHDNRGVINELEQKKNLLETLHAPIVVVRDDVYCDVFYLYTNVLSNYP